MLGFLSFFVTLTILTGAVGLIALTIRNAFGTIGSALRGHQNVETSYVAMTPRTIRPAAVIRLRSAPLRAAA
jgi:hypothetical protein